MRGCGTESAHKAGPNEQTPTCNEKSPRPIHRVDGPGPTGPIVDRLPPCDPNNPLHP